MITVKRLKDLLNKCPDDALVWVYDGDHTGIAIKKEQDWWIEAGENGEDVYTEGFDGDEN